LRVRERLAAAPAAARRGAVLGGGRDEILALVNGRRTARDLAFALGHGLYATMLQVARMRADGLLAPVAAGELPAPGDWGEPPGGDEAITTSGLPRRQKARVAPPPRAEELASKPFPVVRRLLRPRVEGPPKAREV
jgi:hypothetical protein